MSWNFYLPIAGRSLNVFMLLGLGAIVGFLSGLTGVGGGFLMTPLLIMAGIPPTIAAASDSNQIVAATTSGTYHINLWIVRNGAVIDRLDDSFEVRQQGLPEFLHSLAMKNGIFYGFMP